MLSPSDTYKQGVYNYMDGGESIPSLLRKFVFGCVFLSFDESTWNQYIIVSHFQKENK